MSRARTMRGAIVDELRHGGKKNAEYNVWADNWYMTPAKIACRHREQGDILLSLTHSTGGGATWPAGIILITNGTAHLFSPESSTGSEELSTPEVSTDYTPPEYFTYFGEVDEIQRENGSAPYKDDEQKIITTVDAWLRDGLLKPVLSYTE